MRATYKDRYEAYSAGVKATSLDPRAVLAMLEIGIDISAQRSKSTDEFRDTIFDLAITVCDRAKQACPFCSTDLKLPTKSPKAKEVIHKSFEDPALAKGSAEEQLKVFRQVRDEIRDWIIQTFGKKPDETCRAGSDEQSHRLCSPSPQIARNLSLSEEERCCLRINTSERGNRGFCQRSWAWLLLV